MATSGLEGIHHRSQIYLRILATALALALALGFWVLQLRAPAPSSLGADCDCSALTSLTISKAFFFTGFGMSSVSGHKLVEAFTQSPNSTRAAPCSKFVCKDLSTTMPVYCSCDNLTALAMPLHVRRNSMERLRGDKCLRATTIPGAGL